MTQSQPLMNALQAQYRGELSAIEVYERALQKFVGQPEEGRLERLRDEHRAAAARLGALIRRHGGVEPEGSGPWGSIATAIEGVAAVFNDEAPLRVLQRGEVHGHEGYAQMLADPALDPETVAEVQHLLDCSRGHIDTLDTLLEELSATPNRPML